MGASPLLPLLRAGSRGLRRVRRWISRLLLLLLLGVALVLVGAYAILQVESVGRYAITEALPRVNERLPGRIELGSFSGALGSHFTLRDIVVRDEQDRVAAEAARLEIWWEPWDLLRSVVSVSRAELEGADVQVTIRPDGSVNWAAAFVRPKPEGWTPPPKAPGSAPTIEVAALKVTQAHVQVDLRGGQRFVFADLGIEGAYRLERGRHDIDLRELRVDTVAPWDLPPAVIRAEAVLDDLDLDLDTFHLAMEGSSVDVEGRLVQLNHLRFEGLRVRSPHFDLPLLKAFSPAIPLRRSITLDLTLDGPLKALTARGEIGGELGSIALSDVLVGVTQHPLTHAATLDLEGFSLAELLPYPGLPPSLSAHLRWDGRGTTLSTLVGDLTLDAQAFEVQGVPMDGHRLQGHIEGGIVTAHHQDRVGGGAVDGDVTLWLKEGRFDAGRTTLQGVDLAAFRTISRGGLQGGEADGWVSAHGSWTDRPITITSEGELNVSGLQVPKTRIERAETGWSDLRLAFSQGPPEVRGTLRARAEGVVVQGVEQSREATLLATLDGAQAGIRTAVERSDGLGVELDGELSWAALPTLSLVGDRLLLRAGELEARTPEGQGFTIKTRAGAAQLDHLILGAGGLRLVAQGRFEPSGRVAAQVRVTGLDLGPEGPLPQVLPLLPEGPRTALAALGLGGAVDEVFGRIGGTLREPELELRVTGRQLVVQGRPPLDLDVTATLDDGGLRGDLRLDTLATLAVRALPASLSFGGGQLLTLAPDGPWDVELTLPDTSLGRVARLADRELPPAITAGAYSGGITWTGTTAAPEVRAALSVVDVVMQGRTSRAGQGVQRALQARLGATIADGRLEIASSSLRTDREGRILSLDGGADAPLGRYLVQRFGPGADAAATPPPFESLALGARITKLPMSLVHVFVPALRPLTGALVGEVSIGGELDAPELTADLRLLGGRAGEQELKSAALHVGVADSRLSLDLGLEAKAGGSLGARGGVTFPLRRGEGLSHLLDHDDLRVEVGGEGFPLAVLLAFVPDTYDVSGELALTGTVTGSLREPIPDLTLSIPDGRLCHEVTWICYENVHLDAAIKPGMLTVRDASFKTFPRSRNPLATRTWNTSDKAAGGFTLGGYAELQGLRPGAMHFDLDFDRMWASSEETRQAQLDGGITVDGEYPGLRIAGDVALNNVLINLGVEDIGRSVAPMELPDNLVVHRVESRRGPGERRRRRTEAEGPSAMKQLLDALDVDLGIHLTNNVKVKLAVGLAGHGPAKVLNTLGRVEPDLTLKGDVRVLMAHGIPELEGRIETDRGSRLTALTKKFDLQDGSGVDFIGDPLSSQLNLTGVYSTRYGDVRVKVTGSARSPRIVFESDEFDDQADIMALLVTGKPLSELTAAQGSSAMSGVGAALAGFASNTFGKYVPVDLLEVDLGDDFSSGSVQAGKAITPWLFVLSRFRWGAEEDENTIEGQVELAFPGTRNLYLEVVIGDKLVGSVELIYKVLF